MTDSFGRQAACMCLAALISALPAIAGALTLKDYFSQSPSEQAASLERAITFVVESSTRRLRSPVDEKGIAKSGKRVEAALKQADDIEFIAGDINGHHLGYMVSTAHSKNPSAHLENIIVGYIKVRLDQIAEAAKKANGAGQTPKPPGPAGVS